MFHAMIKDFTDKYLAEKKKSVGLQTKPKKNDNLTAKMAGFRKGFSEATSRLGLRKKK